MAKRSAKAKWTRVADGSLKCKYGTVSGSGNNWRFITDTFAAVTVVGWTEDEASAKAACERWAEIVARGAGT